jgi:N-acyl-D-aspartate/D-glutamate deacylase
MLAGRSMRPTLIRGGLLIDGNGGPPLPESALLIDEGWIIAVGVLHAGEIVADSAQLA